MLAGQMLGFARLIMSFIYKTPMCGSEDNRPEFLKIHFLYIAAMETAVSAIIMVTLSFLTKPRTKEEVCNQSIIEINKFIKFKDERITRQNYYY